MAVAHPLETDTTNRSWASELNVPKVPYWIVSGPTETFAAELRFRTYVLLSLSPDPWILPHLKHSDTLQEAVIFLHKVDDDSICGIVVNNEQSEPGWHPQTESRSPAAYPQTESQSPAGTLRLRVGARLPTLRLRVRARLAPSD